ncbi:MAG TPA: sodium:proton antiporter NhaD [Gammaproteobacteria bacterium]|nr:sodium:proton antiporter NhaD [Gammaproteobacteria bacterium]
MKQTLLLNVTHSIPALIALFTFFIAYLLVIFEEFIHLRKSKPLIFASGLIWVMVSILANQKKLPEIAHAAIQHNLMQYAEILLFIIVAITYINVLTERNVFEALRAWLTKFKLSYRQLFWITGSITFLLSPCVDNLTSALAMSAVILALGKDNRRFAGLACINVVVAANAGGAFSPFGDITTLMVWQSGLVPFGDFFKLFLPAMISFLIPALCMHFAVPKATPRSIDEVVKITQGGKRVILLFVLTIVTTVYFQNNFHLPPVIGMMMGLAYLQLFAYYTQQAKHVKTLEIFPAIKELDWDTLLFFYGIMLSIGGLATLGYLEIVSTTIYANHTSGNIFIGILSAIVDNIPLMFAVLTMNPSMSEGQWLLLTLTTGIGGSLLSIGSAAGISVMGQARGIYTFFTHLKWIWAIALGYAASVACHLWLNAAYF